tara:strand:+ start:684 stop:929 length:246 start_codon:yes stop_codon:yes gene_type:complete
VDGLISSEFKWLWSAALGVALYFPIRQLIWVLSVRRTQRRTGETPIEEVLQSMKRRAGFTSLLLCLVFAAIYGGIIFEGRP